MLDSLPAISVPLNVAGRSSSFSLTGDASCCPSLTMRQRVVGFISCWALGWILSILSMGSVFRLLAGRPERFAIQYTIGNLLVPQAY